MNKKDRKTIKKLVSRLAKLRMEEEQIVNELLKHSESTPVDNEQTEDRFKAGRK